MRAGQLAAMSIVHEGPPPTHFMSRLCVDSLIHDPEAVHVSVNDVADDEVRSQITEVSATL